VSLIFNGFEQTLLGYSCPAAEKQNENLRDTESPEKQGYDWWEGQFPTG